MRKRATMTLRGNKNLLKEVFEKVKDDAVNAKLVADLFPIIIYQDTEGYKILMDEIRKYDIKYTFSEGREYTKEEIKSAKYFTMEIVYPWESDGTTADKFGTKYSSNSCDKCSTEKEQQSDLIIDTQKMARYDIATIQPEIIINEKLYNLITENCLTGFKFQPVKDYRGRNELVLHQLVITNVLPQMNKEIRVEIEEGVYCKMCQRNGVFLRSEAVYDDDALKDACDFDLTHEYFGMNLYCRRHIVVSSKVHNLFNKNKIKRVAFEPVRIV